MTLPSVVPAPIAPSPNDTLITVSLVQSIHVHRDGKPRYRPDHKPLYHDVVVRQAQHTFDALCREVENPDPLFRKDAVRLLVGVELDLNGEHSFNAQGECFPRRIGENAVGRNIAAGDFDHVEDVDVFLSALKAKGVRAIVHTTFNHPNEDGTGRLRVFFVLDRLATTDEWYAVQHWLRAIGASEVDTNALDIVRISYAPSAGSNYKSWRLEGEPVSVDALLQAAPPRPETTAPSPRGEADPPVTMQHQVDLPEHLLPALQVVGAAIREECPTIGKRDALAGRLAGALGRPHPYYTLPPREHVAEFVVQALNAGGCDGEKKRDFVQRSVDLAANGEVCTGWPELRENDPIVFAALDGIKLQEFDPSRLGRRTRQEIDAALANMPAWWHDFLAANKANANDTPSTPTKPDTGSAATKEAGNAVEVARNLQKGHGARLTRRGTCLLLDGKPAETPLRLEVYDFSGRHVGPRFAEDVLDVLRDILPGEPVAAFRSLDLNREFSPIEWQVESVFQCGTVNMVIGKPYSGKSFIALAIASAAASGTSWAGRATKPGKVVYLDYETDERTVSLRLKAVGAARAAGPGIKYQNPTQPLNDPALWEALEAEGPDVLVIDSLSAGMSGSDVTDQASDPRMAQPLIFAKELARRCGTTTIVLHHANKGDAKGQDSVRGSGAIFAACDGVMFIEDASGGSGRMTSKVRCLKQRDGRPFPDMTVRLVEGKGLEEVKDAAKAGSGKTLRERVTALLPRTEEELKSALVEPPAAVKKEIAAMVKEGAARKDGNGKYHRDGNALRMVRVLRVIDPAARDGEQPVIREVGEGPSARDIQHRAKVTKDQFDHLVGQWLERVGNTFIVKRGARANREDFADDVWALLSAKYGWENAPFSDNALAA